MLNDQQEPIRSDLASIHSSSELTEYLNSCKNCHLYSEVFNRQNISEGRGKLSGFYVGDLPKDFMLVGLNPSYRRFPGIYQAFGGDVKHNGTGYIFVSLLKELGFLDKIYLTNLLKCSCKTNKPLTEDIDNCFSILLKEIEIVKPKTVVSLGNQVYEYLMTHIPTVKIRHPNFWSSYGKVTKAEYSDELCRVLKNT